MGKRGVFEPNLCRIEGEVAYITLDQGEAMIDADSVDIVLSAGRWVNDDGYVKTMPMSNGVRRTISLHRLIMGLVGGKRSIHVDHIGGNTLDNRKSKLRLSNSRSNGRNRVNVPSDNTSGVRGVTWRKDRNKWEVSLCVHDDKGKRYRLVRRLVSDLPSARALVLESRRKHYSESFEARAPLVNTHAEIAGSDVNGPGNRYVFWLQSCPHACPGCFNPHTWGDKGGEMRSTVDVAAEMLRSGLEGVTFTGGDPMQQPEALLAILKMIHDDNGQLLGFPKGVIVFTGWTIEELQQMPGPRGEAMRACLPYIDLLIDGRFVQALRYEHKLAGSKNQRFHFNDAPGRGKCLIGEDEVYTDQGVEVHVDDSGGIHVTGFPSDSEGRLDRGMLRTLGLRILK